MLQNGASDQGLHYLLLVQQFVETLDSKMDLLKFLDKYDKLKAPYSSKKKRVFIQERFNKLIESINTIIKYSICKTACKISFSLSFLNWIKNEMIFYHISELMLATLISEIR